MRTVLILISLFPVLLYGQTNWSLQNCVDSAVMNNPEMRLLDLDVSIASTNAKASQWNFLPSMNANASHGYNWGQTIDLFTNTFATDRVRYNNFYLSSSVTLFEGLQNYYDRKLANIDKEIALANKEIRNRDLVVQILGAFLQVKLNEEIVALKNKHLLFTKDQLKRVELLEQVDFAVQAEVLKTQAQLTKDNYEFILSQNDLRKSLFLLQTIIGKQPDTLFSLSDNFSLNENSTLDEAELNLLKTERNLIQSKQIWGSLSPKLSLNGSLGSGFSESNKIPDPDGVLYPKPFNDQLNENFYQSLSLTLSIPIFNGINSYSRIEVNKKELERIQIENEQRSVEYANTKLQNQLEINNQRTALEFAQSSFDSYELLFQNATLQYENGVIDYYQYLRNKDEFFLAESELIQAKYRLKFAEIIKTLYQVR
jgi:outer membrane protein